MSSNHSSQYANNKVSLVALRDAILQWRGKEGRRLQVCLALFFPPLDVDLDPVSCARSGRPLGRRRELLKVPIDEQWTADLIEVGNIAKYNPGYRYLLTVVDVFSKHAWVEPLKSKTGKSVTDGMAKILKRSDGRKPINLQTDDGKEFYNKTFQDLMKRNIGFFLTDFHVQMKSNASTDEFPDNASNKFKSRLPNVLLFRERGWKVGLSNITLPVSNKTVRYVSKK